MNTDLAETAWLRTVKRLAKLLNRRFAIPLSTAQEATSRALGYHSFRDLRAAALGAASVPPGLPSPSVWRQRVSLALGSDVDELVTREEFERFAFWLRLPDEGESRQSA